MHVGLPLAFVAVVGLSGCIGPPEREAPPPVVPKVIICPQQIEQPVNGRGEGIVCPDPPEELTVGNTARGYAGCYTWVKSLLEQIRACKAEFEDLDP